jgi:hypothetical protein
LAGFSGGFIVLLASYLFMAWHRPSAKQDDTQPGRPLDGTTPAYMSRVRRNQNHSLNLLCSLAPYRRDLGLDMLLHTGMLHMQWTNAELDPFRVLCSRLTPCRFRLDREPRC